MSGSLLRSSPFVRAVRKHLHRHPEHTANLFEAISQLEEDPFHPSLRTHKLTGVLTGAWACSAGYDLRIIFRFVEVEGKKAILLVTVGTHDEVY